MVDAYPSLRNPFDEHRSQHIECPIDMVGRFGEHGSQLLAGYGEVQQRNDVGYPRALRVQRLTQMLVVPLERLIERRKTQHSGRGRRDGDVTPPCLTAQIRGVQGVAPRPCSESIDESGHFLCVLHERSLSTARVTWRRHQAEPRCQPLRFCPVKSLNLDSLSTRLLKRHEMRPGLAQHDQDAVCRHLQRGEPLRESQRRVRATPSAQYPRDMVDAVNHHSHLAVGLQLDRAGDATDEGVIVDSEAGTKIIDNPRVRVEPSD